MNILITWTNSWIWKYLKENLEKEFNVFKVSKRKAEEKNFFKCDLTKKEEIQNLDFKENIFDLVIFNSWVWYFWEFFQGNLENYEEVINLNILWNIRLLKKLQNNINKNTKLIFIWSYAWKKFFKDWAVYTASKFALRWFSWALKKDWRKVFLVNPKIVETSFHKQKIKIWKNIKKTSLKAILETIKNIISWKETKFEIDL